MQFAQVMRDELVSAGLQTSTYRGSNGLYGRSDLARLDPARRPVDPHRARQHEERPRSCLDGDYAGSIRVRVRGHSRHRQLPDPEGKRWLKLGDARCIGALAVETTVSGAGARNHLWIGQAGRMSGVTVSPSRRRMPTSTEALLAGLLLCAVLGVWLRDRVAGSVTLATAGTVFCGVFVQALPFLVLGVLVSGLIAAYLSPERLARWLPRRHGAAVLAAVIAGAALPGCECGSVPVARRLFGDGAVGAAALAFMLSAPAINPVVLVATAVAFPGQPRMVIARCVASLATALIMGAAWSQFGRPAWITQPVQRSDDETESRWTVFSEAARHDFLQAASYLVIGHRRGRVASGDSAVGVRALAGHLIVGVIAMALLAFVLSLCSEADAFVAASLTMVPLVPRLVFLVVGPASTSSSSRCRQVCSVVRSRCGLPRSRWSLRQRRRRSWVCSCWEATDETQDREHPAASARGECVEHRGRRHFARYVKPALLPWLVASAAVLVVLAFSAIIRDIRQHGLADEADQHPHSRGITWLMVVPFVILVFVTPRR